MSYDLINDSAPVPRAPLPGISEAAERIIGRVLTAATIAATVLFATWWLAGVYADWLWYDQLGYRDAFYKLLILKFSLFTIGGLLAATMVSLNTAILLRLSLGTTGRPLPPDFLRLALLLLRVVIYGGLLAMGLSFGAAAGQQWDLLVLLLHQLPFGITDPQFGYDVSFYVVNLKVLRFAQTWFLALIIALIFMSVLLYACIYLLRGLWLAVSPRMLRHLAGLGIFLMLTLAAHHLIGIYELNLSDGGVVTGATYTDVNARIPVYWFLAGIGLLAAVGFGVSIYYFGLRLMAGAFTLWLIMFLLAGILYPFLYQRFRVDPDEFGREQPYIQRNLEATRAAYGLANVETRVYPVAESLTEAAARDHRPTIDGIRLWDAAPLQDAYNQLQFMELYYTFLNMDSDRYVVDGQLQQVLIGARELNPDLPADAERWVNRRLQYTHGYGVAMTPATGFTPGEGRPEFYVQDIPIRGPVAVTRPEVYYGEAPLNFAIVGSGMREVNPGSESWSYDGSGGVPLSSLLRRLVYALEFGDVNIALSDQVTPQSRIQYRRPVRERVKAVAPFLKLDADPYPVVDAAGKLWWIQDAYTVTDGYPYATASEGGFNYIRNSVKAVVDAYNGDVALYVMEPEEPLLRIYRRAFPSLFRDFEEMPEDLKPHVRYPVTLFSTQAQMYLRYHITDPQVFFNQAEQWDIPLETRFGKTGVGVTPTYLLMRLPGEREREFVLLLPFSPAGEKKNLVGWLAARNDPPNYGQLWSYQLPDDRQIDGPSQVEARIENDQEFSQQFTLWDGSGSEIIRGRLLAIPIADTIVYVEPLYLQSVVLRFPELKKVILADNTNLVMADSMAEGLARLVGSDYGAEAGAGDLTGPGPPAAGSDTIGSGIGPDQLEQLDLIEATIADLEKSLADLEKSLENLRKTLGGNSP